MFKYSSHILCKDGHCSVIDKRKADRTIKKYIKENYSIARDAATYISVDSEYNLQAHVYIHLATGKVVDDWFIKSVDDTWALM